jgi:hypothetical protein
MSVTKSIRDLVSAKGRAQAALTELHERDRTLRESHVAALQACDRISAARPPVTMIVANMERIVDDMAATFARDAAHSVVEAFAGDLEEHEGAVRVRRQPQLWDLGHRWMSVSTLCGLAPELMKARFAAIIMQHVDAKDCAPLDDRTERLREARARVREIEDEHTQLVDACAEFTPPIEIQLIPAVRERREQEASMARRMAEAKRLRESAEAAANARIDRPTTRSAVLSPYIESQRGRLSAGE